jgi:hypothetical protein
MAGIYFIAAGVAHGSENRKRSLDHALSADELCEHCSPEDQRRLSDHFAKNDHVFAWGANRVGDLDRLEAGDPVVDVKDKYVNWIFQYKFMIQTHNTYLQEWIQWDKEKAAENRRPYQIVYFLGGRQSTKRTNKSYFQKAFGLEGDRDWLRGQRWFNDAEIQAARDQVSALSLEEFLGIDKP